MTDAQALYNYAVNVINDHFKGNRITTFKLKLLTDKFSEYFDNYKKKHDEDPENSWLARALREDQFFYYGNYTNIDEFLNNIRTAPQCIVD